MSAEVDVGGGVTYHLLACTHGDDTGAVISFHDQDPACEGIISWCAKCCSGEGRAGPWTLHSLQPLHVEPSIACRTHPHHHGWIRGDVWEQA